MVYIPILFFLHTVRILSCQVSHNGYVHRFQDITTLVNYYVPILLSWEGYSGNEVTLFIFRYCIFCSSICSLDKVISNCDFVIFTSARLHSSVVVDACQLFSYLYASLPYFWIYTPHRPFSLSKCFGPYTGGYHLCDTK